MLVLLVVGWAGWAGWEVNRFGSGILDTASKAQATKENMQKLGFLKIKNFYTSKGITKKVRR